MVNLYIGMYMSVTFKNLVLVYEEIDILHEINILHETNLHFLQINFLTLFIFVIMQSLLQWNIEVTF